MVIWSLVLSLEKCGDCVASVSRRYRVCIVPVLCRYRVHIVSALCRFNQTIAQVSQVWRSGQFFHRRRFFLRLLFICDEIRHFLESIKTNKPNNTTNQTHLQKTLHETRYRKKMTRSFCIFTGQAKPSQAKPSEALKAFSEEKKSTPVQYFF